MFAKTMIIGLVALLVPLVPYASAGSPEAPELTDPTGDVAQPVTPAPLLGPEDAVDLVAAWIDSETDNLVTFNFQVASLSGANQGNQETQRKLHYRWAMVSSAAPDWELAAEAWLTSAGSWQYMYSVKTPARQFGWLSDGEVLESEGVIRMAVPRPLMGDPGPGDTLEKMTVTSQAGPFSEREPDCNKDHCDEMSGGSAFTFAMGTATGLVFTPEAPTLNAAPGEEMSFRIDALYEGLNGRLIESEDAKFNITVLNRPSGWPVQLTPDNMVLGPGENGTVILRTIAPKSTPSGFYGLQVSFREGGREDILNLTVDLLRPGDNAQDRPTEILTGDEVPVAEPEEKESPGVSVPVLLAAAAIALWVRRR